MTVVNLNYRIIYEKIERRQKNGTPTPDSAGQFPRFSGCCRNLSQLGSCYLLQYGLLYLFYLTVWMPSHTFFRTTKKQKY